MRPGSLAVVAVVCALLGASTTLIVAKASGWVGAESATRTVVLTTSGTATPADNPIDENAEAKPLAGNDFDPAQIYRERAAGVVTLIALFGPNDSLAAADAAQGSGFVVSVDGYILTNSHVITTAGVARPGAVRTTVRVAPSPPTQPAALATTRVVDAPRRAQTTAMTARDPGRTAIS